MHIGLRNEVHLRIKDDVWTWCVCRGMKCTWWCIYWWGDKRTIVAIDDLYTIII